MEDRIVSSFKTLKAKCYTQHEYSFYVYDKSNLCDPKVFVKYICRHLDRPIIAISKIDHYNEDTVTFHYNCHEDNAYVEETLPVIDFIKRLSRHIPEKHRIYRTFTQWRTAILLSYDYAPLDCPKCHHKMEFLEIYYNHKRVSLEKMYEKAISKSRGKRSSA